MQRLSVVSLPVTDQQRAKDFYLDQVGFQLLAESSFGDDLRWIQVGPSEESASLTLVTWFDEMPAGSLRGLVIDSDNLQADYDAMVSHGLPFSGPPSQHAGGMFAILIDPDGNRINLHQTRSR